MLTALRISSIDISTSTRVLAGEDAVDTDREQDGAQQQELVEQQIVHAHVLPGHDDGADQRRQQQHRHDLERDEVLEKIESLTVAVLLPATELI